MRTVRAHNSNFDKAKIANHYDQPGHKPPSINVDNASASNDENWGGRKQKSGQVTGLEVAVNIFTHRTTHTGTGCAGR